METLPNLFVKDTLELRARLVDGEATQVPNAVIRYSSDDLAVVTVTDDNRLLAVGVGTATVTATAVGYEAAASATRTARVRGLLEVDSIRNTNAARPPNTAFFGDVLEIFGVGLAPESLFAVTIGGEAAAINQWIPVDPTQRNRLGRLFVWVPPPAARASQMFVLGFNGGLLVPDSLNIVQRDLFELNDIAPADLGPVPLGFRNPGLAFESRARTETEAAVDWYTFQNTESRDRTIVVFSEMVGAETFVTLLTDSIFWNSTVSNFGFGSSAWSIGRETYFCDGRQITVGGEPIAFAEVPFPFTVLALADLPAGTYHLFIPFVPQGEAASYEVLILPTYETLTTVPRDSEEENDYCDVAGPLPVGNASLTIDNPHDVDWYGFSVAAPQILDVTLSTDGTAEADVDLYLIRDFRPDSLVLVRDATAPGDAAETISQLLPPGDYFLVVFDYAGVSVRYSLSTKFRAPPAGAALADDRASPVDLDRLRAKRASAIRQPPLPGLSERLRAWRR